MERPVPWGACPVLSRGRCIWLRCFSAFLLFPCVSGGSGKNENAEKVTEKLEALSVKEESKESEDEETKEKAEEKQ